MSKIPPKPASRAKPFSMTEKPMTSSMTSPAQRPADPPSTAAGPPGQRAVASAPGTPPNPNPPNPAYHKQIQEKHVEIVESQLWASLIQAVVAKSLGTSIPVESFSLYLESHLAKCHDVELKKMMRQQCVLIQHVVGQTAVKAATAPNAETACRYLSLVTKLLAEFRQTSSVILANHKPQEATKTDG